MGIARDEVLEALKALERALEQNEERTSRIKERIELVRRARAAGRAYVDLVPDDGSPIVQLVTESATALDAYGVRVRRAVAQQLYTEGLTMEQIAAVFGVTRQRVSALLKLSSQ